MIATLYIITFVGAAATAMHQVGLIRRNQPIRHGGWLAVWLLAGCALALLDYRHLGWALLATVGMAGVFSWSFRSMLSHLRDLPFNYMGPSAEHAEASRSQYDLLCWRIAVRLGWPPVAVATVAEIGTALAVAIIFYFCHG